MSLTGRSESSVGVPRRRPKDIKGCPIVHGADVHARIRDSSFPTHIADCAGLERLKCLAPASWVVSGLSPLCSGGSSRKYGATFEYKEEFVWANK